MMLNPGLRWIYFAAPRTASSSIHRWLASRCMGIGYKRTTHENKWVGDLTGWYGFTVVRNPYDRLASWHAASVGWSKKDPGDFMAWLMAGDPAGDGSLGVLNPDAMLSQAEFIDRSCANRLADFDLFRFEDLPACLDAFPFSYDDDPLPHVGESTWSEWSPADRALVEEHSALDFERWYS